MVIFSINYIIHSYRKHHQVIQLIDYLCKHLVSLVLTTTFAAIGSSQRVCWPIFFQEKKLSQKNIHSESKKHAYNII